MFRKIVVAALLVLAPPLLVSAALQPPLPAGVAQGAGIIESRSWAVVLGKSFFWDQQAGSDGNACASCHFNAGADTRLRNQLSPGLKDITVSPDGDFSFGSQRSDTGDVIGGQMPSGAPADSNYTLQPSDMPLHRLLDETDRNSQIRTTTNDRVSSQGSFDQLFLGIGENGAADLCEDASDDVFHAGPFAARQVEPRNTPTTINAVFNHRNFWDGRANNLFNGVGPFGMRDIEGNPNLRLVVVEGPGDRRLRYLTLENASLASQAVAPPVSGLEMSCGGRSLFQVGRKLLRTRPLAFQDVHRDDSVLGSLRATNGRGLAPSHSYTELIKRTFHAKYWSAPGKYRIVNGQLVNDPGGYTQMEINFPMFWGIAIMLYESTLVSDQTEFDTLTRAGGPIIAAPVAGCFPPGPPNTPLPPGVDPLWFIGCNIFFRAPFAGAPFNDNGRLVVGSGCTFCHAGPTFTENGFQAGETFEPFLTPTVPDVNGVPDLRDNGFASIGLRPVFSDSMQGATDPYGNPLSFGRQYWNGVIVDPFLQRAIDDGNVPPFTDFVKLEVDGSTKIPTVRNVALTPPYFSWGGYPSLRQVLKTYNRGLNRRQITGPASAEAHGSGCVSGDDSGSGPQGNSPWPVTDADCNTNTSGLIQSLNLLDCDANGVSNPACVPLGKSVATDDLAALERFLKSLTDLRVQCDKAPFDHPSLEVTNGHSTSHGDLANQADDVHFTFPAIGRFGYAASSGFCIPNSGDLFAPGMQARSGGQRVPLP